VSDPPSYAYLLALLRQVATLDYGIAVETDHLDGLRSAIYSAIKKEGLTTEDFGITIATTPSPHTLFILRRSEELPE
jgi:hypothetical protein